MKTNPKPDGSARIFSKALQSTFDSASSQKDPVICKESRKLSESETASLTHWTNTEKSILPERSPSDMSSWIEDSLLVEIQETLCMVPNNETEKWIKDNRLKALKMLLPYQYSFTDVLSSPYTTDSNEEMSPVANGQVSSESSRNLFLSKSNSLKDIPVSETEYEAEKLERPVIHQQEKMKSEFAQKNSFLKNQMCSQGNSGFHTKVKSLCENDERTQFVCKSTNQSSNRKLYQVKESLPKDMCVKNSEFWPKSRNCCEPTTENKNNVAWLPSYNVASLMALKSSTGFFDSHCHLDLLFSDENFSGTYADYIDQHKDSFSDSYNGCIAVFCKPWTFAKDHIWRKHLEQDNVWGAFGCHPKQAKFYTPDVERYLEFALDHPKVRALGEIGLDYSKQNGRSKKEQHFVFRRQLEIAQRRKLRVVIHCREADDDAIKIMHEILPNDAIFHLHCFTGSWGKAQKWIKEFPNVYIGITNLVTFPSAVETHEVARQLPLNRLLLETDAPFFVPKKAPKGTKYSHPGMAIHAAAQIAALKNIPVDGVLQATCANTRFVYNIP